MSWQNQKRRGQNRTGQNVLGSGQRTNQPRSGSSEKLDVDPYYMKAQYHSYNIGNTQGDLKTWCQILCSMRLQCVSKIIDVLRSCDDETFSKVTWVTTVTKFTGVLRSCDVQAFSKVTNVIIVTNIDQNLSRPKNIHHPYQQ